MIIGFALAVVLGFIFAGWKLGDSATLKSPVSKQAPTKQVPLHSFQPKLQEQSPPFEIHQDPPYGLAIAPEEMKEFPSTAQSDTYCGKPAEPAKINGMSAVK